MTCQQRDPDLLLYEMNELPFWPRLKAAAHLRSCARCRARQRELAAAARQIGAALRSPFAESPARLRHPRAPLLQSSRWLQVSPLFLLLLLGLLSVTVAAIWVARTHTAVHRALPDDGCRPGLPNDLCR